MKCNSCKYNKHHSHKNKDGVVIDILSYDYCEKLHWYGDAFHFNKPHKMFIDPMKSCKDYEDNKKG